MQAHVGTRFYLHCLLRLDFGIALGRAELLQLELQLPVLSLLSLKITAKKKQKQEDTDFGKHSNARALILKQLVRLNCISVQLIVFAFEHAAKGLKRG